MNEKQTPVVPDVNAASWIHDNSIAGVTTITVARDASEGLENVCYDRHGASTPIPRTTYEERLERARERERQRQRRRQRSRR